MPIPDTTYFDERQRCPACCGSGMRIFYEAANVPVHSVLLMPTRDEALAYPRGTVALGFCEACGFISNTAFDARLHEYSARYEETQGFSSTFNAFQTSLAQRLISTYDVHDKDIIEIGCGKGEFLMLLCEMGNNRGIGVDPAYVPERNTSAAKNRVTFINDLYSERYAHLRGDFIVCKMTLEHIHPVREFVAMVRRSVGNRKDVVLFFQIPNTEYVLRDVAFWDIYYEHCSYFTKGSLARLFRRCGFDVLALSSEYHDQYLTIEVQPTDNTLAPLESERPDITEELVHHFITHYPERLQAWQTMLNNMIGENKRAVIWGAGSKGVSFLTKLNVTSETMPFAVDINPHKRGTFMAGTGQEIVMPEFLQSYKPDIVIIMNPIYRDEIRRQLLSLGVRTELVTM
jgi:SAM-dependent methyltransferase